MARQIASDARLRSLLLVATLTGFFGGRVARADAPADAQRAQELFDEARSLMKEGKYGLACPKLAQSQALDPGGGTLLNLGICHAREGRTGTAFKELNLALAAARGDGRADRERTAQKHLDQLLPDLCRLTLVAHPEASIEGLSIELDGAALDPAVLGSATPVDPGDHQIRASAPGHKPWAVRITIASARDQRSLEIPILEAEPSSAASSAAPAAAAPPVAGAPPSRALSSPNALPPHPSPGDRASPRWPGLATLGVGVAAVGVGSYFGIRALMLKSESNAHFDGTKCTGRVCADDWAAAKKAALESTVSFAVGLAALGVGAYFELTPSKRTRAAQGLRIQVEGTRSGAAFAAQTEF